MNPESGHSRFLTYLLQGQRTLAESPQQILSSHETVRRSLCAAYFLTDTREGQDVVFFVSQVLPRLLRQLSRTTERQRITYQGEVHGRIDWPATYKARLKTEYNPSLFVCHQSHRREDTPENQLLKYLLVQLVVSSQTISPIMLAAERWTADGGSETDWLLKRVHTLTHHVKLALGHVRLREVELPMMITPRHLLKAETSKTEMYGMVARLYGRYQQMVIQSQWEAVRPIFSHTLLLPNPADPLGDLCVRLAAVGFREANSQND